MEITVAKIFESLKTPLLLKVINSRLSSLLCEAPHCKQDSFGVKKGYRVLSHTQQHSGTTPGFLLRIDL